MKNLKRVRRGVRVFAPKAFNLLVIFGLVFQPVGPAGLASVALAIDEAPAAASEAPAVSDTKDEPKAAPAPEPKKEEAPAPKEEAPVKEETPAPAPEKPAAPAVEEPAAPVADETPAVTPADEPAVPADTTGDEAETSQEPEVVTPTPVEEPVDGTVAAPEEKTASDETDACKEDTEGDTQSRCVEQDKEYVFTFGDEDVKLTFSKLDSAVEHPTVTVKKITLTKDQVEAFGALSDTAYDITSNMEDGSFEYDLVLPLSDKTEDVDVKYVEDEAGLDDAGKAKSVDASDVDVDTDKGEVTAKKIDHFTIYIVTADTKLSVSGSVGGSNKVTVAPGETVTVEIRVKLGGGDEWRSTQYKIEGGSPTCVDTQNHKDNVSEYAYFTESFDIIAPNTVGKYDLELRAYKTDSCGGNDSKYDSETLHDAVTVKEVEHTQVTFCHATPPDTAAEGYLEKTVDDDAIWKEGHGSQHDEDIIPAFDYYDEQSHSMKHYAGKNLTTEGQAILDNKCQVTGGLKAKKVVDDGSLPLWSFKLDNGDVIPVDSVTGEVDFGQVALGAHTITEVGPNASYMLDTVTGTGCQKTGADTAAATVTKTGTTCVFSNLVNKGTITIVKDAQPDDAQDFSFSGSLSIGDFSLDDDADPTLSNSKTVSGLMPGTYTVTENPTQGWILQGVVCASNLRSFTAQAVPSATQEIILGSDEHITCTFTNTKNPVCGDGIVNQTGEQCDGKNGVIEGTFCTKTCQLVPVYQGGASCSEGTVPVKVGEYAIDSKDADGVAVGLTSGQEYLFQASGTYVYDKTISGKYADAAYGTNNGWSGTRSDIGIWGANKGVTSILGDLGSGVGVIEWDGDTSVNGSHVYQRSFTPTTSSARFLISDWHSNWYGNACDNQNCMTDNAGGLKLEVFECQPRSEVKICKMDSNERSLSGWNVFLKGSKVGSVSVLPNGNTYSSASLPEDDYILEANGTYKYRPGTLNAEYTDANYSKRATTDAVYGGPYVPWVNVNTFPAPHTGWLGVMVNGAATDWSSYYNPAHTYVRGYQDYAGQFSFKILDDAYSDNSGSIPVDIYKGFAGTTGEDGCVTFEDVPLGSYTVGEVERDQWEYVSGAGAVEVNDGTEKFTLVNREVPKYPDVEITKTDTPDPVTSGGILTYTLTAKNNGPIAATDVVVTDTLPAQFDLMSVAPSVGSCSDAEDTIDKDIRCEFGTLANGASATVTVKGIALGTGAISNTAEVAGSNGDTNLANNTDTERTVVNQVGDGVCRNNTTWASSVAAVSQGVLNNGAPITDPTRVVPGYALGASDGKFFSLGKGGSLVVKFADPVNDMAGTDLSFHELTNGRSSYPLEKAKVEVSSNGSDWETIGMEVTSEPSGDGVEYLDFGPTGLSMIQYVRITDTTNYGSHIATADGYDIDAIDARCGSGTIIVEKQTNPDGSQQRFGFSPSWDEEGFLLADGEQASFALASDEYSVTENVQAGWTQTSVSCVSSLKDKEDASSISLQPGETVTCTFTNTQLTDIHGYKWDDINGNGERDCVDGVDARSIEDECQLEPLLPGWEIQLSKWSGEGYGPVSSMMTNGEEHYGWYWFEDLLPGEYRICEVQQTGWMQTYPFEGSCHTVTLPNDELLTDNAVSAPEYNFGNFKTGKISGYKWNDCDGDGNRDEEYPEESPSFLARVFGLNDSEQNEEDVCREAGIGGVTVYLDLNHNGSHDENEPSDVTDENGYYEFTGLAAGNYSVQEVVEKGWKQTSNICAGYMRSDDELVMKSLHTKGDGVDVLSGSQFDCPIGNTETPSLSIEKENDTAGSLQPGATVHYKIKVTAHHNDVKGVEVTDLPPKGFTFVGGSQVASQGSLSHVYASPGIWDLGDMAAGQTITLEYDTVIALDQDPGDYKDLAYARGMSETEDPVLADDLMDADNFVGTKVAIVVPEDPATVTVPEDNERKTKEKTVKKTKYVLGASTLPMTGGGMGSVALAIVLFLSGLGLVALSRRKQLMLGGRTIALSAIGALSLMGAGTADAASLAVQMEEPEAVVSSPDFKIGFVTLDIQNRDIEVQCFKEGAASPFETHTLSVGGNSGDCQVSAAVIPADGDYVFYVKAIATDGEEGSETAESEHYAVKLVSTVPGTPYDYDRDDASCMNNITFRTAADGGKTAKVELYRSLSTSFSADASTKVTEQVIGSDTVGSFSVAAPGCSNDSFYALRAVDAYGNASAFVGDKDRNVDTHTVTNTKTTVVETAGAAVGAIPVSTGGNEGAEGQVEGASTTEDEGAAAKEGSVLGDSTVMEEAGSWMGEHPWQTGFGILIIIALIAYAYRQWYNRGAQQ